MTYSKLHVCGAILALTISLLIAFKISNYNYQPSNTIDYGVLPLPGTAIGPESFAFDNLGRGPYTGVGDGRIIRWEEDEQRWVDFAVTSPHREGCEGPHIDPYSMEHICGRPLGMCFSETNGDLYIADAYMGLLKVGPDGGLTSTIATHADGIPFRFINSLDIDPTTSAVYFTDSSSTYQRRKYVYAILSGDKTGRLMRYDPSDRKVKVLLNNLSFPNGVELSKNGNFILLAETGTCKILKYWIKTSKAGTLEDFAQLPGFPDNIKRSPRGGYWVAINSKKERLLQWVLAYPWIGNFLTKLPFDLNKVYKFLTTYRGTGMAIRLGEDGEILQVFEDLNKFKSLSEVLEKDGKLWIGSISFSFIGLYGI
ncbi:protein STRICTOSIDINE SYNTHASE-LIKE 2-like [Mercurialis annua]|uniref:protein STRICTOSIDINE SYNTHASE-LIKE 2-like n=1 Tax=Mercurialis annua TaxID=3986 RepID=UPI002160CF2B|nr:protein STRICTOSIDINE SYNTHASE-LIKE 2-like [Mercurialis annua]